MASHKESCRCRRSDVKVFNYNDDWLHFALTSAHASPLYLCRYVDATMALRRLSRIKQSCCSGTGKAKQQEQKKLRSSSKAGKNTVPTEETQVEELIERDATGKELSCYVVKMMASRMAQHRLKIYQSNCFRRWFSHCFYIENPLIHYHEFPERLRYQ